MGVKSDTERLLGECTLVDVAAPGRRPRGSLRRARIVLKDGTCNVARRQSRRRRLAFLRFAELVAAPWPWTLAVFLALLLLSWLLFAVVWYLICLTHGDFEPAHLPPHQKAANFTPCVYHIHNFASCLLFSIETQHTVGYGVKATTDECPEAIFVNAAQCIFGFIMQGLMAVIIFAKMTLPKLRSQTLLFSRRAAVAPLGGALALTFRVGDMRKDHIIDVRARAFLVRAERTAEGQVTSHAQTELRLQADGCGRTLPFDWPMVVAHRIDRRSPLYYLCPADLARDRFEIVAVLEGTIQSTGQTTQARSSYLASEILWGRRFAPMLAFNRDRGEFAADFSKFDELLHVETPLCSAAYIDNCERLQAEAGRGCPLPFVDFRPRLSVGEVHYHKERENIVAINSADNEN